MIFPTKNKQPLRTDSTGADTVVQFLYVEIYHPILKQIGNLLRCSLLLVYKL